MAKKSGSPGPQEVSPATVRLDAAIRLHQAGKLDEAVVAYRQILATHPEQSDALHLLGVIAQQQGRTQEAIELIRRALRQQPQNAVYHSNLGLALRAAQQREEALAHFRKAVGLDANYIPARRNLATVLQETGRLDEAQTTLLWILNRQPQDSGAWRRLGFVRLLLGRLPEAEHALRKAQEIEPAHAETHNTLGVVLKDQRRFAEATQHLQQAIRLQPRASEPRNNLGLVALAQGQFPEAERFFREALDLEPHAVQTLSNLAVVLKHLGRLPEAEHLLRQALTLAPTDAGVLTNLGDVLNELGRHDQAVNYLEQALRSDPNCAEAHNNLAVALKSLDRESEVAGHLERALQLRPDYTPALTNLGNDLVSRSQVAAAIARFQRVLALDPNHVPAWYALATSTNHPFTPTELDHLRKLVARAGLSDAAREPLHFALATVLDKQGSAEEAFHHAREANRHRKATLRREGRAFDRQRHASLIRDLLTVFHPGSFAQLPSSGLPAEEPVFVVGMPRSGTTLVEQILASHPDVFGAGELDDLLHLTNELERVVPGVGYPRSLQQLEGQRLRDLADRQLARLRNLGGRVRRVIDKTTINFLHLGLIALLFPNARVIHCRRDPGDVAVSCFFHNFASHGLHFTFDLEDLGFYYRHHDRLMEHWQRVLPIPMFEVRYEELVRDQEKWTRDLVQFCGLEWNSRCLNFHQTNRPVKTASAQQVRQPMYTRSVGRWKPYEAHLQPFFAAYHAVEELERVQHLPCSDPVAPTPAPPPSQDSRLARGMELHQSGQLEAARTCYTQVLAAQPEHPDALHLFGVLEHQAGRSREALEYIQRAIARNGRDARYHSNLGLVLRALDRLPEAIGAMERAVQLDPAYAVAHKNLGVLYSATGQLERAEVCFRQACVLQPEDASHWRALGGSLAKQQRLAPAIDAFQRALAIQPADAETHSNLGVTFQQLERWAESEASFRTAIQIRPTFAEAQNNLGILLSTLERHEEALACFEEALRQRPTFPDARHNRGAALAAMHRHAEALLDFRAVLTESSNAEYHNSLGASLQCLGQVQEALACYETALQQDPNHTWAHFNRSQALLLLGDWERGWPEWEWRWQRPGATPRPTGIPEWDGSPMPGGSVLLYAEQGLGDTLQFIRFAQLVKERVGQTIVVCQDALVPLLRLCPGIDTLIPRSQPMPQADAQAPLLSLPSLFHTRSHHVPGSVPYLQAAPHLLALWKERLQAYSGFKIGIAWQGNPRYRRDVFRSVTLAAFRPLAEVPGVRLISLQKGDGSVQIHSPDQPPLFPVVDLGPDVDEEAGAFMDTAAIMRNLDLVITSDTSIPHLAGGLGVPTWVALGTSPDWRWLLDRADSPWYPTMRLFRQEKPGDWDAVFAQMAAELGRLLNVRPLARPIWVEISPGELLDKISILEIKTKRIRDERQVANVRTELESLLRVRAESVSNSSRLDQLAAELKSVNERLWVTEEELRRCERLGQFDSTFVTLARSVYQQNDRRAALKRQINDLLHSRLVEEKDYGGDRGRVSG